ncbi:MAG: glycoside hydrolase family 5 protein [Fibrobacter sp.]|uniref:glycoside hydrolase family 5 protein n=1 Tax=Fibrobacter sp. TaxID=35828 RepID=UPI0025C31639|nr:glycoside hydrolase family 5 protein [Fibrobacter sp.]MBQ9224788.1 glycoside hydrolase family 5 protein [Fibrobacter sp.]
MTMFSKTVKAIAAGAILLGAVEANAAAANAKPLRVGPVQVHGALGTNGGKIVGQKSGKEAMLRGMSMFWSDATGIQYYNKEVIKWAVNNLKIDVFRYAMGVQYYDSDGGTSNKLDDNYSYMKAGDTQKSKIDQMVEAAIENDIYIIIDWHSHRADSEKSQAASFFKEMAQKYNNVPNIIWEVFNEPVNQGSGAIASYANDVISGIRGTGNNNLALVGTPNWSQMPNGSCGTVNQKNVGYVFHFYAGTHSVGQFSGNINSCRSNNAVFITEWGTTTADGKSDANTSASSEWTNFMEQNKISNCNWSLRQKVTTIGNASDEGSAMFAGDKALITQAALSAASYTNSGTFVKNYLTKNATDWASQFAATLKSGSCSFTATSVKETAGSIASSLKSGCTYTSSNEAVVTNAGAIVGPGFVIMTGNDGSQSVVTVTEEPKQTIAGFEDFNCYISGSCTKSHTMDDMDGDGKQEVVVNATGKTDQGATYTLKSLNESIVKVNKATCTGKKCYGSLKNSQVNMFEFTGTIGEAKIVATAPAVAGYIAMNDTITIQFTKTGDKVGGDFKNMKVAKGSTTAVTFPTETTYGKAAITYTFDGQAASPYIEYIPGAPGYLIAGNEDAIVTVTATAPETAERAATDLSITIIVGDSATAASKGNVPIPFVAKAAGKFSAQFVNGGMVLKATRSGSASVEVITSLGQVAKSMQVNLAAGHNWIPVAGISTGKYIVRVKQGSSIQSFILEKK